jgi:hypothetical protein
MRLVFLALLVTASAACATPTRERAERTPSQAEDSEEAVQRMKDEFNSLFPDG